MRPEEKKKRREAGFTLVELMVVIVIIGLLATIVALNVLPSGDTARIQKAKADIAQIEGGLELYKLQNMTFPNTSQGLNALVTAPAGLTDPSRYQRGGYLKKLPNDPWGRPYLYASPGTHGEADAGPSARWQGRRRGDRCRYWQLAVGPGLTPNTASRWSS